MMADTVSHDALAGFLISNPKMASFELLNALRNHPVGDAFPQYQMLEKSGGLNGSSPAEVVAMFLKAIDCDGVQIVADCLRAWNACVDADPALAQPWRQMLWLSENVGQEAEPPTLNDVAADMATLSEHEYDRQRKGAASALGVRVTVLDRVVERVRKGESPDEPTRPAPLPETGSIPLKLNDKGRPLAIVYNAIQIMEHDQRWLGVLAWDEFAQKPTLRRTPPYVEKEKWSERETSDADDVEAAAWLQKNYDTNLTPAAVHDVLLAVASRHPFHPVKEFLDALEWDGTGRLDDWLCDLFGCEGTAYIRAVAAKTLIAAVARIYLPGCKADAVTILEGEQGIGKSSVWRVLAGDAWFSDGMPDLHSKDAMQHLAGKWVIELAELSAMNRSDVEAVKRFLSATQDHYRPSYGRHSRTIPRQCIFVGSTNADSYLKDTTGNRRFWPVPCQHEADLDTLRGNRNQLWAEAAHRFKSGEAWTLPHDLFAAAAEIQQARLERDEWEAPISAWLETQPEKVSSAAILERALALEDKRDWTPLASRRIAAVMQMLGWVRQMVRIDGAPVRGYRKLRPGERLRKR